MSSKDILSIGLSILALILSVGSFYLSFVIGQRQFALAANKPLVDLAGRVIALIEDVYTMVSVPSYLDRKNVLFELSMRMQSLIGESAIVISYCASSHTNVDLEKNDIVISLKEISRRLAEDHSAQTNLAPVNVGVYADLAADFTSKVVQEMRRVAL